MEYVGQTAVVTGAASGIGRALAVELAGRGANVAISDVNSEGLAETAQLCDTAGTKTIEYHLDVADRGAVLQHAEEVVRDFGDVHLVVNNAGVALGATVEEMTWPDYDWLMGINLGGVVNGTKAFLPYLIDSGDGHPGGIDTNIARNARTSDSLGSDREKQARDFSRLARTSPEAAAKTILRGVDRNRPRILIGADARVYDAIPRVFGARYEGLLARGARRFGPRLGIDLDR